MANAFDIFDSPSGGAVPTSNPFDQFDTDPSVPFDPKFPVSADDVHLLKDHKWVGPKPEPGMPGAKTITGIGSDAANPKRKKELDKMFGTPEERAAKGKNPFDAFDAEPSADAGYLSEFGKAGVRGAGQIVAQTGKGLSELTTDDAAKVKAVEDGIANLGTMTPEQANAFLQSIPANLDINPVAAINYQMAARALWKGDKAKADAYLKTARLMTDTRPVEQQQLYKQSEEFSKQFDSPDWKPSPGWENSWTAQLGNALGTTAALGGAGVLSGGTGVAVTGGAASVDQQRQMAQQELEKFNAGQAAPNSPFIGKTPEEAKLMVEREAKLGFIPGASEEAPVEMLITQAGRVTPGLRRFMATPAGRTWVQRVARILRQTAAEGGQEGVQQVGQNLIHQFMTNPNQDITEGVADNALIGALVGGGSSSVIEGVDAALPAPKAPAPAVPEIPSAAPVEPRIVPPAAPQQGNGLPPVDLPPTPPGYTGPTENVAQPAQPQAPVAPPVGQAPMAPQTFKRPVASPKGQETPSNAFDQFDAKPQEAPSLPAENVEIPQKPVEKAVEAAPEAQAAEPAPSLEGTRQAPVKAQTAAELAPAREQVNTEPSEAQKESGVYRKGHLKLHGLDITMENPRGSVRRGKDADGKEWASPPMPTDYGYIRRTEAKDGDQVDTMIGPNLSSPKVFVIDQMDLGTKLFDESKILFGLNDSADAEHAYDASFSDGKGPARRMAITEVSVDEFKQWLKNGNTKAPFARQRDTQSIQDTGIQSLEKNAATVQQSEGRSVSELRGKRAEGLSRVEQGLPVLPEGIRAEAKSEPNAGPNRQREGLPSRQRPLGNETAAVREPTQHKIGDIERTKDDSEPSGQNLGPASSGSSTTTTTGNVGKRGAISGEISGTSSKVSLPQPAFRQAAGGIRRQS